uniref:Uncharacterized protein n=1 Tax=Zea mays TaxID=4577 RepID=A0A804M5N0_MAIZE
MPAAVIDSSSRERVPVSAIRERGASDIERVRLVDVQVHPEGGVQADGDGGDGEGDEEVDSRAGERDGERGGRRERGQHGAVVDLAAEADERAPVAAAEVEPEPGDEERQEHEHGDGAVDEAQEDERERGQRVVGAEVGEVAARPRAGLPAALGPRERRRVQHLPPRARPPRPRERPRAGEEGDPGLRRRSRDRGRGRRLAARGVVLRPELRRRRRRRRGGGRDGTVARPRRGGGWHGGALADPKSPALDRASGCGIRCAAVFGWPLVGLALAWLRRSRTRGSEWKTESKAREEDKGSVLGLVFKSTTSGLI